MTRAIFVRHGQSVSNAHPELAALPLEQGDELTELGRRQSQAAAEALRAYEPTALLSSAMGRARQTAEIIGGELEMEVRELPYISELRESRNYATMRPEEQKLRRWSTWMVEHGEDPDFSWQGGESFDQVRGRVRRLKDELGARP